MPHISRASCLSRPTPQGGLGCRSRAQHHIPIRDRATGLSRYEIRRLRGIWRCGEQGLNDVTFAAARSLKLDPRPDFGFHEVPVQRCVQVPVIQAHDAEWQRFKLQEQQ